MLEYEELLERMDEALAGSLHSRSKLTTRESAVLREAIHEHPACDKLDALISLCSGG